MALISDLANAIPTKSDIIEIQRGQTSSNNVSVEQLMQLSAVENLADSYDSTSTYSVGDWCVYEGTLYQCNTAITTAEAFDSTKWDAKKVVDMTASDIPMSSSDSTTIETAMNGAYGAIDNLNTTTRQTITAGSDVTNFEQSVFSTGKIVSGYIVFKPTSVPSSTNAIFGSGFPIPPLTIQLPCICISGTNFGKASRVAVNTSGHLISFYAGNIFSTSDTYLIPINYAAA